MRHMGGPEPAPSTAAPPPIRSLATAYLLWFLLGIFGAHRFYLGDRRGGRWYLIGLAIGIGLPVAGLILGLATETFEGVAIGLVAWITGLVVLLAVLLAAIVDAFRLPGMTRRANAGRTEETPGAPA
jgi:TM2 domain-containing membrane protein YozV